MNTLFSTQPITRRRFLLGLGAAVGLGAFLRPNIAQANPSTFDPNQALLSPPVTKNGLSSGISGDATTLVETVLDARNEVTIRHLLYPYTPLWARLVHKPITPVTRDDPLGQYGLMYVIYEIDGQEKCGACGAYGDPEKIEELQGYLFDSANKRIALAHPGYGLMLPEYWGLYPQEEFSKRKFDIPFALLPLN